jgi:hypothetical protein
LTARRRRATAHSGWRGPQFEGDFPTLGWQILDWTHAYLPSPADPTKPLLYTDEQAQLILRWYQLDPVTGEFPWLRFVLELLKGWGKSPFAGSAIALPGLAGPVCFDGWDANGLPVGAPWGTGGRPPPWIQIAAVSEDQTDNTYAVVHEMLTANDGRAADALRIDAGLTRCFLRDRPGRIEPVTTSAGAREGQRITDGILDETHLLTPRNGGTKLAATLRRNAAKMGGRITETTNAPVLGEKSVAEQTDPDKPHRTVLYYARRPAEEPDPGWPPDRLREALNEARGDAHWVNPDRLLADIADPANAWEDALRFWFNIRTAGGGRAVDPRVWDLLAVPIDVPAGTRIGLGFDGSISRDATFLRGCTAAGYSFLIKAWTRPHDAPADWKVDRADVHNVLANTFATYDVGLMLGDPPYWWTELEQWAQLYGDEVVLAFETNQATRFAPAVGRWLTAIREGTHTHDGDELTTEHVKAAHLRKVRLAADEDDGRTKYVLVKGQQKGQIDGAVADVLALEAAMTMPEAAESPSDPFIIFGRGR